MTEGDLKLFKKIYANAAFTNMIMERPHPLKLSKEKWNENYNFRQAGR